MGTESGSKRILCLVGTRPEAIKMAPVVKALRAETTFQVRLISSDQHRDLVQATLQTFDLHLDGHCDVMVPNQSLESLTSKLFASLAQTIEQESPDLVLAQGDTRRRSLSLPRFVSIGKFLLLIWKQD